MTSTLKRKIEDIGFAKPWQVLASDFAHPHLTYCFRADTPPGLALEQHTDGAPKGSDCVAQPEFLMGVLLEDVPSPECGPYVYWPKSHLRAIDHLEEVGKRARGSHPVHSPFGRDAKSLSRARGRRHRCPPTSSARHGFEIVQRRPANGVFPFGQRIPAGRCARGRHVVCSIVGIAAEQAASPERIDVRVLGRDFVNLPLQAIHELAG